MDPHRGDLTDEALREEIELVGDLVVAASSCPGRMTQEDVDSVLGVGGPSAGAGPDGGQDGEPPTPAAPSRHRPRGMRAG